MRSAGLMSLAPVLQRPRRWTNLVKSSDNWGYRGELKGVSGFGGRVEFAVSFESFGFGVRSDITDSDDGRVSQNIICAASDEWMRTNAMPAEGVRIDLISGRSCPFRREEYLRRVREQETALTRTLGADGYQLLSLYPEASAALRELAARQRREILARENLIHT